MKDVGCKRTMIARIGAALGFVCGTIGLGAGLTDHTGYWGRLAGLQEGLCSR